MSEPKPMRIGDAERDEAISALSDHFAAGRLTKAEYDERADQALNARFQQDLAPLFEDLPGPARDKSMIMVPANVRPANVNYVKPVLPLLLWLLPMLAVTAIIVSLALGAPWMLFGVFWFVMLGGLGRRHHQGRPGPDWRSRYYGPR
ncbi:hypothetical protein GCM10009841_35690 [Microlunatus panaciterrae]|uniref:Membrane protein n=1 Tax=Microlunatus panaciterrae TaxID=400768 RepID=A0ABS2RGY3_9ACTN|nr:DUF1707 domain-containing protein [Microlunatus panaciterrae]MBM7798227.1 putative membrane protein [Microlunatus panaciterrae]